MRKLIIVIVLLFACGCIERQDIQTLTEDVDKLKAGIEATKPFNPYADEMNAGLGLGLAILGIFVKGKIDEKNRINAKYSAAKIGMDKFKNENPDKAKELYDDVGEARKAKKVV